MDDSIPPLATPCWIVAGPTASGKSDLGCLLAQRLGGEVLSLDSMAIYQGMDVGTAKPTAAQRAAVPHHLLDLVQPTEEFSVSEYLRAAHQVVQSLAARGRVPIFVGGTPLWLKGLLRGLFVGPPPDWEFRESVEREMAEHGTAALRARLWQVDPISAHRLHPNDTRRMIRALEVAYQTGRPLSHLQTPFDQPNHTGTCRLIVLGWPRETLHQRINQRVERMFALGLVDEVRELLQRYGTLSRTAGQAVGYREVIHHLAHNVPLPETIAEVQAHTRQLARRQETWLRGIPEAQWVPMSSETSCEQLCDQLLTVA